MIIRFLIPNNPPLTTFGALPVGHAFRFKDQSTLALKCPDLRNNCNTKQCGCFYFENHLTVPTTHFFENRICSTVDPDWEVYDLGRMRIIGEE